jgi:hypothetical protein
MMATEKINWEWLHESGSCGRWNCPICKKVEETEETKP